MPRKKIMFDTRDSLDILRDAFVGEIAPVRKVRVRLANAGIKQEEVPKDLASLDVGAGNPEPEPIAQKNTLSDWKEEVDALAQEQERRRVELEANTRHNTPTNKKNLDDPKAWGLTEDAESVTPQITTNIGRALEEARRKKEARQAKTATQSSTVKPQASASVLTEEDVSNLLKVEPSKQSQNTEPPTPSGDPHQEAAKERTQKALEAAQANMGQKSKIEQPKEQPVTDKDPDALKKKLAIKPTAPELAAEQLPETLDKARAAYVRADMEMRQLSLEKGADPQKLEDATHAAEQARHEYAEMWEAEKEKQQEPERKAAATQEALRLLDERIQARMAARAEKNKNIDGTFELAARVAGQTALKVGNWYRKQSFKTKVVTAGILMGAGAGGAMIGGVLGTGIVGGVFAANMTRRTLGALGTASGTEAVAQKIQEKMLEKKVQKRIAEELSVMLESTYGSEELNRKLSRIEKTETAKRLLRYVAAAAAGFAVFNIANIAHAAGETETGKMAKDAMRGALEKLGIVDTPVPTSHPATEAAEKAVAELQITAPSEMPAPLHPNVLEIPPATDIGVSPREIASPKISTEHIMEHLAVGKRGPEGAISDYFKANHETAKTYGWDGKEKNLAKWAGKRAHELWLDNSKEALADESTLAEMKRLGYPQTPKGYANMMRHIGKGAVDFDTTRGKIGLTDMEYLKAKPSLETHTPTHEALHTAAKHVKEVVMTPPSANIAEAPFNPNTFLDTFSDHPVAEQTTIAENLKHTSEALEQEIAATSDPTLREMKKSLLAQTQEVLTQSERWHTLHGQWLTKSGLSESQLEEVMEKWDVRKFLSIDKKIQSSGPLKGPLEWALGTHGRSVHELAASLKSKTLDPHFNLKEALKHIITK